MNKIAPQNPRGREFRRVVWGTGFLVVLSVSALAIPFWPKPEAQSTPPPKSTVIRPEYRVFSKVLETKARLHIMGRLAVGEVPLYLSDFPRLENTGTPHGGAVRSKPHVPWDNGKCLRSFFWEPASYPTYSCLTDAEFENFISDPFTSPTLGFQYNVCAASYPPGETPEGLSLFGTPRFVRVILSSQGPDEDRDIDLTGFNMDAPWWGLGSDVVDNVYDPTNGIVSNGDIIYPPGLPDCMAKGDKGRLDFDTLDGNYIPCF